MPQVTRKRYKTTKQMEKALRLVDLCIQSMAPNVTAEVSSRPRLMRESIDWTENGNWFIGYRENASKPNGTVKRPKDWNLQQELDSEYGKQFWTHEGMLGRIRGMARCPGYIQGSLVDKMAAFITSEVNISFLDLRKVFRYIYGINDIVLFAALKELFRQDVITVASVIDQDDNGIGPFTIHATGCSKEVSVCSYTDSDGKVLHRGTWYNALNSKEFQLDSFLMHMFSHCLDDLCDSPDAQIAPFEAIKQCYAVNNAPLDNCYAYLRELMQIKTRNITAEDYAVPEAKQEDQIHFVQLLDNAIQWNMRRIQRADDSCNNPDEYMYIADQTPFSPIHEDVADESDIEKAIQLLEENMDSLRRDKKTGKVINAEKVSLIFNEIHKVFPLKTLYEIFKRFETEAEVVRRDVRSLCKKGKIIAIERGMYCSKEYSDIHFSRIGRNPEEENTILESCIHSVLDTLGTTLDLFKTLSTKLANNTENIPEDDGSMKDDEDFNDG